MRTDRISIVIPTLNRFKFLDRFITNYNMNCQIKTDIIIANAGDKLPSSIIDSAQSTGNTVTVIKGGLCGYGRNKGMKYSIEKFDNEFIFQCDDDAVVKPGAIEKMLAVISQDERFGVIGHLGGFRRFMRDFEIDEVRFHITIGVLWVTSRTVVNKIGNIDKKLNCREDNEFTARCWHNGIWTGIVDAPIIHKRHQKYDDGIMTIPKNYSDEWNSVCDIISHRYPDVFKSKNGRLYRQFKFPKNKFRIDHNLKLVEYI